MSKFKFWSIVDRDNPNYVDSSLTELTPRGYYSYVNLHSDPRFPVDYSTPPAEIETENESVADQIYRKEYEAYVSRKDFYNPLWKLHQSTLERVQMIIDRLEQDS